MPFKELKTYGVFCDRCNVSEVRIETWKIPTPVTIDKQNILTALSSNYNHNIIINGNSDDFGWQELIKKLDYQNWKYEYNGGSGSNQYAYTNFICPTCIMKDVIE